MSEITCTPDDAEAYFEMGETSFFNKDFQEAIKNYTKAFQLKPNYTLAFHKRGLAYARLSLHHQAVKDFD